MKLFCYNCGEQLITLNGRTKFCSSKCGKEYRASTKARTIANYFPLFKNIVSSSRNLEEFNKQWQKYFKEVKK